MKITLSKVDIDQAITQYLGSMGLPTNRDIEITLTTTRKPPGYSAEVDLGDEPIIGRQTVNQENTRSLSSYESDNTENTMLDVKQEVSESESEEVQEDQTKDNTTPVEESEPKEEGEIEEAQEEAEANQEVETESDDQPDQTEEETTEPVEEEKPAKKQSKSLFD